MAKTHEIRQCHVATEHYAPQCDENVQRHLGRAFEVVFLRLDADRRLIHCSAAPDNKS
jgi:hypothetical protein